MDNKFLRKYFMSKLDVVHREAEVLQALVKSLDAEDTAPTEKAEESAPKKTTTKTTTKKAAAKKEVETEVEATDETEAEGEESDELDLDSETEPETKELTTDDVRQTVKKFALKHGKDKALKLLQKFKTTSIGDLKPADYAKVIELAQKHM